ncbi:hypothetical protein BC941DRAFT_439801 [Chlamydoabsidia padenii]|nr:hypothetical protein BC941DRAFT_439801 [Chlamydoabsidia padenii]
MVAKRVQFSGDIAVESTFGNEDYDRTAQEVATLTYSDMMDLLKMKSQWRRDMERMMAERANREKQEQQETHHPSVFTSAQEICT